MDCVALIGKFDGEQRHHLQHFRSTLISGHGNGHASTSASCQEPTSPPYSI